MKEPKHQNAVEVADALRAMHGSVGGLASITVGIDINRGPRASDRCLITTHKDTDALAAYQSDAIHGEVKRMIGERTTHASVVDFEV